MRTVDSVERQEVALKEEKKLLRAEAAFRKKKADGKLTAADREKMFLARQEYRLNYRQPKPGAAPGAIGVSAQTEGVN